MQRPLITERLVLQPATAAHVGDLWGLWTDREVRRYLWDDREISRDEAARTLADCEALAADGLGLWVITPLSATGRVAETAPVIGCAGLLPVSTAAEFESDLQRIVGRAVVDEDDLEGVGERCRGGDAAAVELLQERSRQVCRGDNR